MSRTNKKKTLEWQKKIPHKSTADKFAFVRECLADYLSKLQPIEVSRSALMRGVNIQSRKRFFLSRADVADIKHVPCVGCNIVPPKNDWLCNPGSLEGFTPLCSDCYQLPQ
jgi:hypothetical protein